MTDGSNSSCAADQGQSGTDPRVRDPMNLEASRWMSSGRHSRKRISSGTAGMHSAAGSRPICTDSEFPTRWFNKSCVTRTSPRRWIFTWRRWAPMQRTRWEPWKQCVQLLCNPRGSGVRGLCRSFSGRKSV